MLSFTVGEFMETLRRDMEAGTLRETDVIGIEYWTYEDVLDFVHGDPYYGDVTPDMARRVWANAMDNLQIFDNVDYDGVRDAISAALDKEVAGNE